MKEIEYPFKHSYVTKLFLKALEEIRIHTAEMNDVIARTSPGTLTSIIAGNLMGSSNMDFGSASTI